jgi:hypothetical protein
LTGDGAHIVFAAASGSKAPAGFPLVSIRRIA